MVTTNGFWTHLPLFRVRGGNGAKVPKKLRFSSLVAIWSALCFEFVNDSVFHFQVQFGEYTVVVVVPWPFHNMSVE
jgi:hypothetical protein